MAMLILAQAIGCGMVPSKMSLIENGIVILKFDLATHIKTPNKNQINIQNFQIHAYMWILRCALYTYVW